MVIRMKIIWIAASLVIGMLCAIYLIAGVAFKRAADEMKELEEMIKRAERDKIISYGKTELLIHTENM